VIARNPDVIFFSAGNSVLGYDIYSPKNATEAIEEFLARPEFSNVEAVKNKQVYMISIRTFSVVVRQALSVLFIMQSGFIQISSKTSMFRKCIRNS
jgi:ABC-type Fe3+-hydroxamate transport system substrate-binding protein